MTTSKKVLTKKDMADIEAGNIEPSEVLGELGGNTVRVIKKKKTVVSRYTNLAHGDHIACVINGTQISDARVSINPDGSMFICQNSEAGAVAQNLLGYSCSWGIGQKTLNDYLNVIAEFQITKLSSEPVAEVVEEPVKAFSIVNTFNADHITVLESAIRLNNPVLLVGHTGLGKTTLLAELAKLHGKKLIRLSVHSGVTADEILGKWLAEAGSTIWQDGLLIQAMKNGDWIVFDEINACPADVMFALHSLLDDDRHVTLLEKRGEVVKPQDGFRFFATMNPQDDYAGTKEVNMAFMSRFNAVIEIEPYDHMIEVEILRSKGLKKDTATKLVSTANKLRAFKKADEIIYFCGTRDIINTGLMIDGGVDIGVAMKYGIFNKMNTDDKEFVKGKVPDFNYKSKEQLEIERLRAIESALRKETTDAKAMIAELQKKVSSSGGNANLDANTLKALKILKVLK